MADRGGSVRVSFPSEFQLSETVSPPRRLRRAGTAPASQGTGPSENEAVLDGLERSNFTVVRDVTATPAAAMPVRRVPGAAAATVEVDLAPDEDAVVLLEQEGVYSWKTDYSESPMPVRRGVAGRTVTFAIPIETQAARTRSLKSLFFVPIRAIVVKFVARLAAGKIADHLEADIHRGLVKVGGTNLTEWTDIAALTGLGLDQKDAPRILLFLHGTFSSTRGSFGALVDSAWGKAFLDAALKDYDAIVGFDHSTLREDPRQNAKELLRLLRAVAWKEAPRIDVVTFSRGGLVYRTLVEELLPGDTFKPRFDRSIFVAVPNAGTHLADPKNWRDLVDLYTNLSAALFRIVKLIPHAQTAAFVLSEAIAIIGSLVKSLTDPDVVGDKVPGLTAMNPEGEFIAKLNEVSDSGPSIGSTYYCYVTSDFEAQATGAPPQEIPPKFWLRLADGFVDRLLKSETSDLVIDTKSVPQIDTKAGKYMKEWYEFPTNSYVYHTNYFTRPEVADSLTKWLRLTGGGARTTRAAGAVVAPAIPAGFDSDIMLAAAEDPATSLRERIELEAPSYVVVRRWFNDQTYHYAFPAETILERLNAFGPMASVSTALDLHESGRSRPATDIVHIVPTTAKESEEREILFDDGFPVAVKSELPVGGDDVAKLAVAINNPLTPEDRILRRRMMPSGINPPPAPQEISTPRRRTRGRMLGPSTEAKPVDAGTSPAAPKAPTYHFLAQMDSTVERNRAATIDVMISRSGLTERASTAAAVGETPLAPDRKLILEVFARRNFVIDGAARIDIDVASLSEPKPYFFDVKGTDTGEGEVWVIARQGQTPLLTLVLKPTIVDALTQPTRRTQSEAAAATPADELPFHKLTIRESDRGGKTYLNFELEAPALNFYNQFESAEPLRTSREAYVRKLYAEIEAFWAQNSDDAERFVDELRARGMALYDELIPLPLQQALWQHRNELQSIMVVSTEPFVPWEVLYLHEPGKAATPEARFFGQMGLVRWLYGNWPPVKLQIREGKARYVAPNYPPPNTLPSAQDEGHYLAQTFGATAVPPRYSDVKALLATADGFDLLHFACHGENDPEGIDTRLLLESGDLKSAVVSAVAQFGANGNRPIVVLNACQVADQRMGLTTFGGFAKAFLSRDAGVFIAPLWSVGDREATLFSHEIYEALQRGTTLSEATTTARKATLDKGEDASWLAYAVYGHPHARCKVDVIDAHHQ